MAYQKKTGKKIKSITPQMQNRLNAHAKNHSVKHIKKMKILLREGKSFAQSHAIAKSMVGV